MRFLAASLIALAVSVGAFNVGRQEEAAEAPTNYDGIRFIRLAPSSENDVFKLQNLVAEWELEVVSDHGINVNLPVDVLVTPDRLEEFDAQFSGSYEVVHQDLGAAIAEEASGFAPEIDTTLARFDPAARVDLTWWNNYHTYADHVTFVTGLQAQFPARSEVVTAGQSVQGKAITGIHIFGSGGKGSKPAIIFHGTVHAREWISTPTVEYLAYQLLSGYANSTDVKTLVDTYDFYIFPVVNPDGFSFSQTTTRLWRKNRTPAPSGSSCIGVDLNRNWGIRWSDTGGASTSPCAEDYKGTSAESTPEIKGLIAFSKSLIANKGIKLYIDFHSYGQLFLYPYGYDCSVNPESSYYVGVGNVFETA